MKHTIRTVWSVLLLAALLAGLLSATALAAPITFTDVPANAWYYADVQKAVDTGLVGGYPDNTYGPDRNMTYAEAIKLAAVMYKYAMTGSTEFETGSPWYQPYVNFAKNLGIITKDYEWNAAATRAGYMEIFAKAIPDVPALAGVKGLTAINEIADGSIPDVPMTHPQAAAIYKLYRAGVLQGSDAQHSCKPESNIRRSEVAAILTRMMNADERIAFTLGEQKPRALTVTAQPADLTVDPALNAVFSVTVGGGKAPYQFVWYYCNAGETSFAPCSAAAEWYERFPVKNEDGTSTLTVVKANVYNKRQNGSKYYCVVTDAEGATVTSETATLTVTDVLSVAEQPKNTSAVVGGETFFLTEAIGGKAPYQFEWYYCYAGGTSFAPCEKRAEYYEWFGGVKEAKLTVKVLDDTMNGSSYYCLITDSDGKQVKTETAVLTVDALRITAQPKSALAAVGGSAELSVEVTGGKAPYQYVWYYCYAGETSFAPCEKRAEYYEWFEGVKDAKLTVKMLDDTMNGSSYYCVITDSAGAQVKSETAKISDPKQTLAPTVPGLTVEKQPQSITVETGKDVDFFVSVKDGKAPYKFQWYYCNAGETKFSRCEDAAEWYERYKIDSTGGTFSLMTVVKAGEAMPQNGAQYYCVITDEAGASVTSDVAILTVADGPR
ncbi:MAG: S-layer homology domain-containing protein [Oscillospiraceae bacterium]|nr:S-layer homology domain-containing protein [Oscillospiraceae bacterium]